MSRRLPDEATRSGDASPAPEGGLTALRIGAGALGFAFALAALIGTALSVLACVIAAQVPNNEVTQGEFSSPPASWGEVAELVAIASLGTLMTGAVIAGAVAFCWFAFKGRPLRRRTGVAIAVTPAVAALLVMGVVLLVNRGEARPAAVLPAPDRVWSALTNEKPY